ncbi:MAG: tetratricopeptide repeat protein, partial [Acidobacteria bacterium]|nr:tetratricopeptide repeat protein [Acidobacteriota bacterium]
MKQNFSKYLPWFFAGVMAVVSLGASSAVVSDRDLIIKLQGEVIVLQRQLRDLQESIDKSQGQTTALLQRMADSAEANTRLMTAIDDQIKSSNTAQTNNLAGTASRLSQISEKMGNSDQRFNQINQQINALRETIEANQRRADEERNREKQERQEREKQPEAPPTINSPDQLYGFAFQQFSAGKYEQAITNFRRYLEAYGQTEAADNAQFMVAESFFALNRQQEALAEYDRCLTNYPRGDKTPSALFKKGVLLLQLERREEGVNALRNVIATFPTAPEAAQAT